MCTFFYVFLRFFLQNPKKRDFTFFLLCCIRFLEQWAVFSYPFWHVASFACGRRQMIKRRNVTESVESGEIYIACMRMCASVNIADGWAENRTVSAAAASACSCVCQDRHHHHQFIAGPCSDPIDLRPWRQQWAVFRLVGQSSQIAYSYQRLEKEQITARGC